MLILAAVYLCAPFWLLQQPSAPQTVPEPTPTPTPAATMAEEPQRPYRAVWVSYLEWQQMDFSTEAAFRTQTEQMLDKVAALGATVVLAQVRPFADALYPSAYFPLSHLCTGQQGQALGFDPLEIWVTAAHARGLQLEAWVNPYRVRQGQTPALCAQSPAVLHPDWVKTTDTGCYFDPANPAVRQYIADALGELCQNYAVDGVHFDDYFYPTTDPAFDADDYAAAQTPLTLAQWRTENVNALMQLCRQTVHGFGRRFGVAPAGDPAQCAATQYSDAALWLRQPGYADYVMPQLYWGLQYTKNGDTSHSLARLAAQWAALPRSGEVALYAGLGAYRIGAGDGSDTPGEWQTGHALADQWRALQGAGILGGGLYRYDSLFNGQTLPARETAALTRLWAAKKRHAQRRGSSQCGCATLLHPSFGFTPSQKIAFSCLTATRTRFFTLDVFSSSAHVRR